MQLVIPEEFISESSKANTCEITVPTVGDLVNRRSQDKFPFIRVDASVLSSFDSDEYPELSDKYRCMTVGDSVYEMQATAVDLLTGKVNGHTEVMDLQDIRAGCSAYIAGKTIPKKELLSNGGMMYQYTKYLTDDAPMVDSMQSLLRAYAPDIAVRPDIAISCQRDTRDLDLASEGLSASSTPELDGIGV